MERVHAAIFIDAIVVSVRDGQVRNQPLHATIGVDPDGHRDILGIWPDPGRDVPAVPDVRRRLLRVNHAGRLATLAAPLPAIVAGVGLISVGFFAAHGVASAWVSARASRKGAGTGLAGALYLFAYYAGSSICGAAAGAAWSAGGWPAVAALSASVAAVGLLLALSMRGVPVLPYPIEPAPPVQG